MSGIIVVGHLWLSLVYAIGSTYINDNHISAENMSSYAFVDFQHHSQGPVSI